MPLTPSQAALCAMIFGAGVTTGAVVKKPHAPKPAVVKAKASKPAARPSAPKAIPAQKSTQTAVRLLDCPVAGSPFSADPNLHIPEFNLPALPPAGITPGSDMPGVGGGGRPPLSPPTIPGVPEPSGWLMLLSGFGMIGLAVRRR